MNDTFFCYSKRLRYFLSAFGERYISVGVNQNTNTKYWTYKKSQRLDDVIRMFNDIKYK